MKLARVYGYEAPEVGWIWNPTARLRCVGCGAEQPLGPAFDGCGACSTGEPRAPLEVAYEEMPTVEGLDLQSALHGLEVGLQPISPSCRVSLGRSPTPLVPLPSAGANVLVKNETLNPTWAHKDRLHEVAVGVAKLLGCKGVVTSSTGNHGAAAAAHAAAAGLRAVIFCRPRASTMTLRMISAYGGVVAQLDPREQGVVLKEMVADGWFPATSMDPAVSVRGNPYGAEGYKPIAYEIVAALGRLPEAVIIPTASGDTVYGVSKGFAEVADATGSAPTRTIAVQPETANPLQRSMRAGRQVRVKGAESLAVSVSDDMTGRQAMAGLRRWNGYGVSVSERDIGDSVRAFAEAGLLLEPASAISLAGYRRALQEGLVEDGDLVVLLATCAGIKWPEELAEIFPFAPVTDTEALAAALDGGASPLAEKTRPGIERKQEEIG